MSTASKARVLGTAINSSWDSCGVDEREGASVGAVAGQDAKEQKFMVLTWRRCSIQGLGLGAETGSRGRVVLMAGSSSAESFHTISLLSLPCVMMPCRPHSAIPRIALS